MPKGSPRSKLNGRSNIVGERVKARRVELKLTQDALCARLAVETSDAMDTTWNADKQEIYKIESGIRAVNDIEVLALAKALECDPSWLMQARVQ